MTNARTQFRKCSKFQVITKICVCGTCYKMSWWQVGSLIIHDMSTSIFLEPQQLMLVQCYGHCYSTGSATATEYTRFTDPYFFFIYLRCWLLLSFIIQMLLPLGGTKKTTPKEIRSFYQGIEVIQENGNSATFFLYAGNAKYFLKSCLPLF